MINSFQIIFLFYLICVYFAIANGYTPSYGSNYLFALPPIIGYIGGIAVRSQGGPHRGTRGSRQDSGSSVDHRSGQSGLDDDSLNESDSELNIRELNLALGCNSCNNKNVKYNSNNAGAEEKYSTNSGSTSYFRGGSDDHYESISSGIGGTLVPSDIDKDQLDYLLLDSPQEKKKFDILEKFGPSSLTSTPIQIRQFHEKLKTQQSIIQKLDPSIIDIHSSKVEKDLPKGRKLRNQARVYKNANELKPKEYYDYETFKITWNDIDRYEIINKIGRGKYSEVFFGVNTDNDGDVVIKILKPIQKFKIQREISILEALKGGPNIIPILDTIKDPESKICSLVFPLINKTDVRELINYFTDYDLKYYMYQLLIAIDYTHSRGIMHRDIKPQNIAIDHINRKLYLLDWGLAEYYHPNKNYNIKVASRHYKPPELLVNMFDYDYSLDMWSLGCFFAGLILDRDPFFNGDNNDDQLLRIAKVLGTKELYRFLNKYGLSLNENQESMIKNYSKKSWEGYIPYENDDIAHPTAIDFLDKLLKYDPYERMTAKEAMDHPYFDQVRSQF